MEAGTILTRGEWLHKHAIPGTVIADTRGRRAVVVRHRERKQVVAVGGAHVWWETDYLGREWRSVTRSVDGVCDETYEIVGNIRYGEIMSTEETWPEATARLHSAIREAARRDQRTVTELAVLAGCRRENLSRWLHRRGALPADQVDRLRQAVGVEVAVWIEVPSILLHPEAHRGKISLPEEP